jgi:hypothetical protein
MLVQLEFAVASFKALACSCFGTECSLGRTKCPVRGIILGEQRG